MAPTFGPTFSSGRRKFRPAHIINSRARIFSRNSRPKWMIEQKKSEPDFRGMHRQRFIGQCNSRLHQSRRLLHQQSRRRDGHATVGRATGRIGHRRVRSSPRRDRHRHDRRRERKIRCAVRRRLDAGKAVGHTGRCRKSRRHAARRGELPYATGQVINDRWWTDTKGACNDQFLGCPLAVSLIKRSISPSVVLARDYRMPRGLIREEKAFNDS